MAFNPNRDAKGRFASGSSVVASRKRVVKNFAGRGGKRVVIENTLASGAKQTVIPARKRRR